MTQYVLAVVLGLLFALGTFLVLRRDVVRVVWGVIIIGQAANLYLVTMGGLAGTAPVGKFAAGDPVTDPLVQALVLTAIVIGFGTTAFALVLAYRVYETRGSIDLNPTDGGEPDRSGADGPAADGPTDSDPDSGPGPDRGGDDPPPTATDGGAETTAETAERRGEPE